MTGEYDENSDTSQTAELYAPETGGLYTSQLHDWIPLCPQLRDSAARLYWTMRALVVEKYGPVRKLTLRELCYLLPAKPVKPGEKAAPSSLARIRSLLSELSDVGLISTPEGGPVKTSSRASASASALRIRINDKPKPGYDGPRNAFALLDAVRKPAAEAAATAIRKERERAEQKRTERAEADAGQISSPQDAGQISSPLGQISSPLGQKSGPHSGADLQDHEPPLSLSAESYRSEETDPSVRPSVQVEEACASKTDGRTDAGGSGQGQTTAPPLVENGSPAAADTAPGDSSNKGEGSRPATGGQHREATPGAEILLQVARQVPELALGGRVLTDQARRLDGLLIASHNAGDPWMPPQLVNALSASLDGPIRVSAGAVISARISTLPLTPRAAADMLPGQATGEDGPSARERSVPNAADRTVYDSTTRRTRGECPECGGDSPGGDLCGNCQGWPQCEGDCGRVVRGGGVCESCEYAAHHATIAAAASDDGECPGHGGVPCGRPVLTLGLCGKCRIKAEETRNAVVTQWETAKEQVIAAVKEVEERQQSDHAPF